MNLKQIKADRANGVLISSCTWDAVLDYAIAMQQSHNQALDEVADLVWNWGGLEDTDQRRKCRERVLALKIAHVPDSTAIGKPDGEGA